MARLGNLRKWWPIYLMVVFIDIETRSRADLPEVGAARYGCDDSTEVFMMAVAGEQAGSPVYLWVNPKFENAGISSDPRALELLHNATEVVAHNAPFEMSVLSEVDWLHPAIPLTNWRCTQAMARIAGLPDSLGKCAEALKLNHQKDLKGRALIRLFSIPKDDGTFNEPKDFPDKWAEFCSYCRQDVEVEREIWKQLYDFRLSGELLETWQLTLRMNTLGIPVNVEALRTADVIIDVATAAAAEQFKAITGLNITQREKIRQWLKSKGVELPDMRGETLLSVPTDLVDDTTRLAIELYTEMSFAAAKKIKTMLNWVMPDGRMRGVFKFYGAGTGRWSAGGPQIQNAKKPSPAMRPITKQAYESICNGATKEGIEAVYGNPVEVVASCVRHFIHQPGASMLDADYNAIEARIACWLAGEQQALEDYRKGVDRYKLMASQIFDVPQHKVTSDQRDLGKQAILGLSYGMGADKFQSSCQLRGLDISSELAEKATTAFRKMHPKIVKMWRQLGNQFSFFASRTTHHTGWFDPLYKLQVGAKHTIGRLYAMLRLPSGRVLWYPEPSRDVNTGECTYFGQIPGTSTWGSVKIYGAKIFENACQAVAADVMSAGARQAESCWMLPFALIHDQAMAIHMDGQSPDQFAAALTKLPPWATGLPLKAEAKIVPYYTK